MSRATRALIAVVLLYAGWIGMMAVHELGHVLHAMVIGAKVERVVVPLLGFSRTDVASTPHRAMVIWGGPIWGCTVPLLVALAVRRTRSRVRDAADIFAGFCLIANGCYLAMAVAMPVGDAHDLIRLGVPPWIPTMTGGAAAATGVFLWHRVSLRYRLGNYGA